MRESKFANHEGQVITFNDGSGYTFNPLPLYSYGYNPMLISSKIAGFSVADTLSYPVEIGVKGNSMDDVADKFDRLLALFESDISALSPGRLTVNGYSLDCYISGMSLTQDLFHLKSATFTVFTDVSKWFKEQKTFQFTPSTEIILDSTTEETEAESYPHGYPHGYPNPYATKTVRNSLYTPAKFRLTVFGPCTPSINIGGHIYAVDAAIADGEILTIDSRTKQITKRAADGTVTNLFDSRNRDSYIFEPIPVGDSAVSWHGINKIFLTLIDERTIPPWSV